jgi:hypothetical protein
MADTAANLVDRILPAVPYRQWVLSLPRQVRFLLARDADLLGQVVGMFLHKVFAWQRRRARAHGIADPHCGAVTFVQRFGSMLNLNCHAHALVPDGVFAANSDGSVLFHPLPPPWDVLSVEHEDPVWGGTEDKIQIGLEIAERTLRPLLVR